MGVVGHADIETEQAVLGGIIIEPSTIALVAGTLRSTDFYLPLHGRIFETACRLHRDGAPVDKITLLNALTDDGQDADAVQYVCALELATPLAPHAPEYAKIVRRRAMTRRLLAIGEQVPALVSSGPDEARRELRLMLEDIEGDTITDAGVAWLRDIIDETYGRLLQPTAGMTGIPTGISIIDQATAGLQDGNLIVLAARTSHGKTAMALTVAHTVAVKQSLPVLLFSLEMSREQLGDRLLSIEARVPSSRMSRHDFSDEESERLTRAASALYDVRIQVEQVTATVEDIVLRAAQLARAHGIGLIIVDYLHMIRTSNPKWDERIQLGHATKELKRCAMELDVPVILLAQINRGGEGRLPRLDELKSSGATEEDADVVIMLYRPVMHDPEIPAESAPFTQIHIAKNRQGPRPMGEVYFEEEYMYFANIDHTYGPEGFTPSAPKPPTPPSNDMGRIRQILEDGGAVPRRAS